MIRRSLAIALLSTALVAVSASSSLTGSLRVSDEKQKQSLAFANSFLPSLQSGSANRGCSFVGDRSSVVAGASLDEMVKGMSGVSMSCRRNLKKEKRARNEQMARQFRKPETTTRGRGGGRAAAQRESDADSEWLSQIYGQHTIYRRDQQAGTAQPKMTPETEARQAVPA